MVDGRTSQNHVQKNSLGTFLTIGEPPFFWKPERINISRRKVLKFIMSSSVIKEEEEAAKGMLVLAIEVK